MDEERRFNYLLGKMQKRVEDLERKVYWLEKWKKQYEEKEYQRGNK
jgi:hypothetical protein